MASSGMKVQDCVLRSDLEELLLKQGLLRNNFLLCLHN